MSVDNNASNCSTTAVGGVRDDRIRARGKIPEVLHTAATRIGGVTPERGHRHAIGVVDPNKEAAAARAGHRGMVQRQFEILGLRCREGQIDVLARCVGDIAFQRSVRR